jgi:hypothetical protein
MSVIELLLVVGAPRRAGSRAAAAVPERDASGLVVVGILCLLLIEPVVADQASCNVRMAWAIQSASAGREVKPA